MPHRVSDMCNESLGRYSLPGSNGMKTFDGDRFRKRMRHDPFAACFASKKVRETRRWRSLITEPQNTVVSPFLASEHNDRSFIRADGSILGMRRSILDVTECVRPPRRIQDFSAADDSILALTMGHTLALKSYSYHQALEGRYKRCEKMPGMEDNEGGGGAAGHVLARLARALLTSAVPHRPRPKTGSGGTPGANAPQADQATFTLWFHAPQ
ncbi:hypothetical protein BDP55DRAFT_408658 [Colletotrichum godetiae]|uniref:Uncharacterized protein n=1 Tax=Colletotrichum godetiae TaxID=1209918 RepID=A0AAJ0EW32_9PEZI|nr:uncharacterized protein BDP55DRAFT_408658 [Colletotrichum godetiae]KAK1689454.1 hypothetical protein BDP55DRAFT_408658 [Colletotrichum godetiae]